MRSPAIFCIFLTACGAPPAPTPVPPATNFIALGGDFDGFASWDAIDLGEQPANGLHLAGHRVVYLNRAPAHGATTFSKGTIAVKVITDPATLASQVFAMAKRGPGFNPAGAVGWEWFELASPTGSPVLKWRGASSPTSGVYAGSNVTCNTCHQTGRNDSVLTAQLALDSF